MTGAGTLAKVTFRALTAGSALVGFASRQALDKALRPVMPISVQPAHIDVQDGGGGGRGGGGGGGGKHLPQKPDPPGAPVPGKVPPGGGVGPVDG